LATILLCGPVLVTRTAGLFPGEFFTAVYGGSFAGMTSVLWLSEDVPEHSVLLVSALFILLSVACGLAFGIVAAIDIRAGRRIAGGYGGRSGAIAAVASFVFVELAPLFGADNARFRAPRIDMLDLDPRWAALSFSACLIGTVATLLALRRQSVATAASADRTFLAAVIALMGLVALQLNDPNDTRTAEAFYAGCFLGMSTPERLRGWIQPLLGAIVLTAMLAVVGTLMPGVGGSLGFAAFVTVAALVAVNAMVGRGGSLEDAVQEAAGGRLLQLSAYASSSPMFGIGHARAIVAGSVAGLLLTGWLVLLPDQRASLQQAEAPAQVVDPAAIAASPASVRAMPGTDDDDAAVLPRRLPVNISNARAAATELHPVADVTPAVAVGATAEVAADPGRAEATATPSPATAQHAVPIDNETESHAEMFRQFIQWESARAGAQAALQPAKRIRNAKATRSAATAALPPLRPARRPDRPNSAPSPAAAAAGTPTGHGIDQRRAAGNAAIHPASDPTTP
jgi:hypothetical protein